MANKKHKHKLKNKRRMVVFLLITAAVLLVFGSWLNGKLQKNCFYPVKYSKIINREAAKYDMDPYWVLSVIKAESNFDEQVVSSRDAIGLMQLKLDTAQWCAEKMGYKKEVTRASLFDPDVNITLGVWYLDYLCDYYGGDMQLAIIAYNAGLSNVDKWLKSEHLSDGVSLIDIPFEETKGYVKKINTYYDWYKNLYENK